VTAVNVENTVDIYGEMITGIHYVAALRTEAISAFCMHPAVYYYVV
jgi:hypothetical protein